MHLPNTLYERAPHYWIFVGMLLVVLGLYLGVQQSGSFMLLGVTIGLASCAWGIRIMVRRARRDSGSGAPSSAPTE